MLRIRSQSNCYATTCRDPATMEIVADKRARKRPIPAVTMSADIADYFRQRLIDAADRLEEAAGKADTAVGAVERLIILERLLADLADLRSVLTAWTVEDGMGEAPMREVGRRIGKSGPTVARRYSEEHVERIRSL